MSELMDKNRKGDAVAEKWGVWTVNGAPQYLLLQYLI